MNEPGCIVLGTLGLDVNLYSTYLLRFKIKYAVYQESIVGVSRASQVWFVSAYCICCIGCTIQQNILLENGCIMDVIITLKRHVKASHEHVQRYNVKSVRTL